MKKHIGSYALLAAMAFSCPGFGQHIGPGAGESVTFKNESKHAIWVTTYLRSGRGGKLSYGCAEAGRDLTLGVSYSSQTVKRVASEIYVLAEVKASATSCSDHSNWRTTEGGAYNNTTLYLRQRNPSDANSDVTISH